jgi:hypothetical protein
MRASSRWLGAAVLGAVLAGCETPPGWIAPPYYRGSYQPGETSYQGLMPVVVRGNPFPDPNADVARSVADAMQGHAWWPTQFVPATVDPRSSYRVVVLFSPPPAMPYPELCSAAVLSSEPQARRPGEAAPRTPLSAALCKWDVLMAATSSTIEAAGPDDPRFRGAMAGLARTLFPLRNPDDAQRNGLRISGMPGRL